MAGIQLALVVMPLAAADRPRWAFECARDRDVENFGRLWLLLGYGCVCDFGAPLLNLASARGAC